MERAPSSPSTWAFVLFSAHALLIGGLAARSCVPELRAAVLPVSDIGGWNMYQYRVTSTLRCVRVDGQGETELSCAENIHHGSLVSTTHPNVERSTIDGFAQFLARREAARGFTGRVEVRLSYRIEDGPPIDLMAVGEIP